MVIRAVMRAAISRLYQAGCARLTEDKEAAGSRALWRAAARMLIRGACVVSMGDILGAARMAAVRWLERAVCAQLTEETARGSRALWRMTRHVN
jgi:hypothetical protein